MARKAFRTLFVCVFLVLGSSTAYAQSVITGTVRDVSGAAMPGVTVEAASPVLIEKVNAVVSDGDRMLLTSFHYWKGLPEGLPDPVFTYYLVKKPIFLVRSHTLSFADLLGEVRQHRLDWALLSPEPESSAAIINGLQQRFGLIPAKATTGALLYRTTVIYQSGSPTNAP